MIDNPEYTDNDKLYELCGGPGCTHIRFELWQVKLATIFDDIIITDSLETFNRWKTTNERVVCRNELKNRCCYERSQSYLEDDDDGFDQIVEVRGAPT